MSNVMSLKSLKNNVKRNGFDLSFKNAFTAKAGELLPVMCKEVIPGDKFKISGKSFTRTQPLFSSAFVRMREYYDVYFVPYKLLWNRYNQFFTNLPDFHHAASINSSGKTTDVHPYITTFDLRDYLAKVKSDGGSVGKDMLNYNGFARSACTLKLLEYLGYGQVGNQISYPVDVSLNPNPLLAYQKIYQDFYRDDQWESAAPWRYNLDYMMDAQDPHIPVSDMDVSQYTMFDLNYVNYAKDYFMGVLPSKQYGDEAFAPIGEGSSNIEGYNFQLGPNDADGDIIQFHGGNNGEAAVLNGASSFTSRGSYGSLGDASGNSVYGISGLYYRLGLSKLSGTLSILSLRQAEALQKWKEIAQSGRQDYKTQMEKHFGVSPSEAMSDHCRYLGGWTSNLDINEVVNTNLSSSDSQADIKGKGTFVANGSVDFEAKEHGIIMCLYHCVPLLDYGTNGIRKLNLKTNFTDYALPEFDAIGMQEVLKGELAYTVSSVGEVDITAPLGYAPRYADYKTSYDEIHGAFNTTLPYWVAPLTNDMLKQFLQNKSSINYTFFKVNPHILDNLFGVEVASDVDTDQFLINSFFDIKVVRNLDYNGLPY